MFIFKIILLQQKMLDSRLAKVSIQYSFINLSQRITFYNDNKLLKQK